MKQLETAMESIAKDIGMDTVIRNREDAPGEYVKNYFIGFKRAVRPADFFRLEIAIREYFDSTVQLLPEDAEKHNKASEAYLRTESIQAEPSQARGFMGLVLEPAVSEGHRAYSAVDSALKSVIVAANACKKKCKEK